MAFFHQTLKMGFIKRLHCNHGGKRPWEIVISMVAALIYFVTPIDVIPDVIPGIGFCDDIAVLLTVKSLIGDVQGAC